MSLLVRRIARAADVVSLPPTIQALLAARLDQLAPAERAVLERGSVEGPARSTAPPCRRSRPAGRAPRPVPARGARPQGAAATRTGRSYLAEDAFRFRHLLHPRCRLRRRDPEGGRAPICMSASPPGSRAHGADHLELDEVIGYHLEPAYGYRVELGAGRQGQVRAVLCAPPSAPLPAGRTKCAPPGAMCARPPAPCSRAPSRSSPPPTPSAAEPAAAPRAPSALQEAGGKLGARRGDPLARPVEAGLASGERRIAAHGAVALNAPAHVQPGTITSHAEVV